LDPLSNGLNPLSNSLDLTMALSFLDRICRPKSWPRDFINTLSK
jgi:hypothetical protein